MSCKGLKNYSKKLNWITIPLILLMVVYISEAFENNISESESVLTWNWDTHPLKEETGIAKLVTHVHSKNPDPFFANVLAAYAHSDILYEKAVLHETETNSGVFEEMLWTCNGECILTASQASKGNAILVEYSENSETVTTASLIGMTDLSPERISVTNARTISTHHNATSHPTVGKQILLTSDITNHLTSGQTFTWIVQIVDSDNMVESLSWVNDTLNPGEIRGLETSWIPTKTGDYKATFFVWEGIAESIVLSYPIELGFTVFEKPPENATNKRITIEIGEPVNRQGLLPIITTETTKLTERLGFVSDWNFLPLNHGEQSPTGGRLSWDILPPGYQYLAISGKKDGMQIEIETTVSREDILHAYPADCHGTPIEILYSQPVTIEVPKGLSSVSVTVSDAGLLPVNGLYKLEFASFFDHHIQLQENAIVIHSERTVCSVDMGDFTTGLYDVVIFRLGDPNK